MDGPRRVHGRLAVVERPGPHLVGPAGEEHDEPQQAVRLVDQPVTARLRDGEVFHELLLLRRVQLRQFHLNGAKDMDDLQPLLLHGRLQRRGNGHLTRLGLVQIQDH